MPNGPKSAILGGYLQGETVLPNLGSLKVIRGGYKYIHVNYFYILVHKVRAGSARPLLPSHSTIVPPS